MSFTESLQAFGTRVGELADSVESAAVESAKAAASRLALEYATARANILTAQTLLQVAVALAEKGTIEKAQAIAQQAFDLLSRAEQRLENGVTALGTAVKDTVKDGFQAMRDAAVAIVKPIADAASKASTAFLGVEVVGVVIAGLLIWKLLSDDSGAGKAMLLRAAV